MVSLHLANNYGNFTKQPSKIAKNEAILRKYLTKTQKCDIDVMLCASASDHTT